MVHVSYICPMNTGELHGLNFEASLNHKRHTNAGKLNFGGSFWQRNELYVKKKKPKLLIHK